MIDAFLRLFLTMVLRFDVLFRCCCLLDFELFIYGFCILLLFEEAAVSSVVDDVVVLV